MLYETPNISAEYITGYKSTNIDLLTGFGLGTSILGALANIYTAAVLVTYKQFHKPNYILILGVVLADLICDTVFIPLETIQTHIRFKYHKLFGNNAFCIWEGGFYAIFFSSSSIGQLLVALNRYIAVYLPNFYRTKVNKRSSVTLWFLFSLVWPTCYYYGGYSTYVWFEVNTKWGDCTTKDLSPIFTTLRSCFFIYLPLSITLLAYILIVGRILTTGVANRKEVFKRASGSAAMLANIVFYAICMVPHWVSKQLAFNISFEASLWIKLVFRLSYSFKPIFYVLLDQNMRRGFVLPFAKYFAKNKIFHVESTTE